VGCLFEITDLNFGKLLRGDRRLAGLNVVKAVAFKIVALKHTLAWNCAYLFA